MCQNNIDPPAFIEYDPCAIVKVYVYIWVQYCVDGDTEMDATAENASMVTRDFPLRKTSKGNILMLRCDHSLDVLHLCMHGVPILNYRVGCFVQDFCF